MIRDGYYEVKASFAPQNVILKTNLITVDSIVDVFMKILSLCDIMPDSEC